MEQLNQNSMEDLKTVYFSVNQSKLQNGIKLRNQINDVINFFLKRYNKTCKNISIYMGFNRNDDFLNGKFTLEIKFYL